MDKLVQDRTLAFKNARMITNEELKEVGGGGGGGNNTTSYTTKQTFDNHGNWDVGADVQWD